MKTTAAYQAFGNGGAACLQAPASSRRGQDDVAAAEHIDKNQGRARGYEEENGGGLRFENSLMSPESKKCDGGSGELRREILAAWGHETRGEEREMTEEGEGYL